MNYLSTFLVCLLLVVGGCKSSGGGGDADESIPAAGAEDFSAQDYAPDFRMWEDNGAPFADAD
ncbi:MAG: hypothetical protein PVG74_23070, partial [Desulfobacterales bacterium]